jgi:ParB family chromosome partitioning protein
MRNSTGRTSKFLANLQHNAETAEGPDSATAPRDDAGDASRAAPTRGLGERIAQLGEALGGNQEIYHFNQDNVRIDPKRCCPWKFHDRNIDALNVDNCADLIEGFQEAGRQTTPGLVRPLKDDPQGYAYEVLIGLRRWWVCQHLGWRFEAEIRNLDDGEAFLASDVENRSRKDLSDYERAWKYRRSLLEIYSEAGVAAGRSKERHTQESLARQLGKTAGWMTQLLDLTNLPDEVVRAFPSTQDILVNHARRLKEYLDDSKARVRVIARAREIAQGKQRLTAKAVVAQLEKAGKASPVGPGKELGVYLGVGGARAVRVERKGQRDLRFDLTRASVQDLDEAIDLLSRALKEHF